LRRERWALRFYIMLRCFDEISLLSHTDLIVRSSYSRFRADEVHTCEAMPSGWTKCSSNYSQASPLSYDSDQVYKCFWRLEVVI
jgi:hypothetical protein